MTCLPHIVTTSILVSIAPLSTMNDLNAGQMLSLSPRPELPLFAAATGSRAILSDGIATGTQVEPADQLTQPHALATPVADVIVRVRGGATCTGTPITGTKFVVTAAHCVLVGDDVAASRTVQRDGVEYTAASVLVNPEYPDSPGPRLDAAVLVMDQGMPGPSATLGDALAARGPVTLAGFQPSGIDGSLLRGIRPDNRPHPQATAGGVVKIETAALPNRTSE